MPPRVLILRAPGTNCDAETAHAFRCAGGAPEIVSLRQWIESPRLLADYQIFCLPGGFSFGDDLASGRILGLQLRHHYKDALREFVAAGKLILGICNGFQTLVQCGLLPGGDESANRATLTWNDSATFNDCWAQLAATGEKCPFLTGMEQLYLPIAHGEGKFVAQDEAALENLNSRGQLVLRYNTGSQAGVAGVCDPTGRIFGLMPHPERYIDPTQHPRWTRGEARGVPDGLLLLQNAVNYFR